MEDNQNFSDEDVVQKIQDGNPELFSVIIKRYESKLLRYTGGFTGDREIAADIVQNSFIKAFVNLQGFNVKMKFSSWIYRIVHNEALNVLKKNIKEVAFPEDIDFKSEEDIADEYDKKETSEKVDKCFGKMPILYSEPLFLYYIEDRSHKEISDILKIPMGTVATRISRAKILMKKLCKEM